MVFVVLGTGLISESQIDQLLTARGECPNVRSVELQVREMPGPERSWWARSSARGLLVYTAWDRAGPRRVFNYGIPEVLVERECASTGPGYIERPFPATLRALFMRRDCGGSLLSRHREPGVATDVPVAHRPSFSLRLFG